MDISAISSIAGTLPGGFAASLQNATPAQQRKAVSTQFEAIMMREMLAPTMSQMMGGDDSPSGSIYGYMLTDVFSQQLAQAGGLGLAKIIAKQLTPPGQDGPSSTPVTPPAA